jgi:hypothetical protein
MQMLIGVLIGIGGVSLIAGLVMMVRYMRDLNSNLKSVGLAFRQSSSLAQGIEEQNAISRQMVAAMDKLTGIMATFNRITLAEPIVAKGTLEDFGWPGAVEDDRERPFAGRTPPPPFVPSYEEYPAEGESDVIVQTEEEMAELDAAEQARAQGIETDPLRVAMPSEDQIVRG